MKRLLFGLCGVVLLAISGIGLARDVEADPNKDYQITPDIGPWMICVHAYTGPQAPQLAHDFVLELRRSYQLPAYVFNRGAEEHRKQQEEIDRVKQMCPEGRVRIVRIEEQCAVLIGGYKDMDSARHALEGIKKLKMPDPERVRMDALTIFNPDKKMFEAAFGNPFQHGFVARNPTAPKEQPKDQNDDFPFLQKLNAGESYSLLKCGKPWTLAVASFEGATYVQSKGNSGSFFDFGKWFSRENGERLNAAAMNAHNLAEAFRDKKFGLEAYVLHTRYRSVVSIGRFDGPNDPKMGEVRRAIARMQDAPGAIPACIGSQGTQGAPGASALGFGFLTQPRPMEVPHP